MSVPQPLSVVVDGRTWNLFDAAFTTPDGTYSFNFYAISHEHASMILDDIKATAVLTGQVVDCIKNGERDDA